MNIIPDGTEVEAYDHKGIVAAIFPAHIFHLSTRHYLIQVEAHDQVETHNPHGEYILVPERDVRTPPTWETIDHYRIVTKDDKNIADGEKDIKDGQLPHNYIVQRRVDN